MKPIKQNKTKKNNILKQKIKFMITSDRTEIRRSLGPNVSLRVVK